MKKPQNRRKSDLKCFDTKVLTRVLLKNDLKCKTVSKFNRHYRGVDSSGGVYGGSSRLVNDSLTSDQIFLPMPIDKAYEAKYLQEKSFLQSKPQKTLQGRIYLFLEHPVGWLCFFYHFGV